MTHGAPGSGGRVPRTVLVYQMGKVGSQTVAAAARPVFADVVHTHDHGVAARVLSDAECIVVTGVREPVARCMSAFFENISRESHAVWYFGPRAEVEAASLERLRAFFLDRLERHYDRVLVPWFDRFCDVTGVGVAEVPLVGGFGAVTRAQREVHLYRVEALDRFLEAFGTRWQVALAAPAMNVAEEKWVGPLYRRFRDEVRLPAATIDRLHALPWVRHCYSGAELAAAKRRFVGETPTA